MIKAVIFDVDGVLIHSLEANHKFFSDLLGKFGHKFMELEEYISHFHLPMKELIRNVTKIEDEIEIEKIYETGRTRQVPYPDDLIGVPEKLDEVIKSLGEKYKLGIVTSRSGSPFYIPQIEHLKNYFAVEVIYPDTERHKPHPEPLILAAQRLNLAPEECVYVGDSESDMFAAKGAGMKGISYSKKGFEDSDVNITEFSKLEEAINTL